MTGRRGRKRKQLLDNLKERRGDRKLKVEAINCTFYRELALEEAMDL